MKREAAIMNVYRTIKSSGDRKAKEAWVNAMNLGDRSVIERICKSYGYPLADAVDSRATAQKIAKYITDCRRAVN